MQWASASRPVPAVICGGMPTVSSGSQITIFGIISGWKITFLVWVASCVMTPARPTSEPVPAGGGTAMIGRVPLGAPRGPPLPDILELPHGAGLARHEGDDLAGVERRSAAEGHDAVMHTGLEGFETLVDICLDRVRLDVREDRGL